MINIKDIIKNKIHIGHIKSRRNPYMSKFIINVKNKVDIINPLQFSYRLKIISKNLTLGASLGGKILYYGNKPIITDLIKFYSKKNNMPYINYKWTPGLLTNIYNNTLSLMKKDIIKKQMTSNMYKYLPIREKNKLYRKYKNINKRYLSIKNMDILPLYIIITNTNGNDLIIKEAKKMGVLIVGIVDSDSNPINIDYPIPANDDYKGSINFILNYLTNSITMGLKNKIL
ncbi:MAG: 30S ribosomal protein S2 [Candidatus Shikimatogenerans sp. AspAUS03]|uniref:Small ribosomal subunit protein uS2 n=1 Tax=Candidatus Shikimatogenerans sp. AspAUS03 TaxID=3158563 RepID=A0AAU7QSD8_9FLAO